MPRWRRTARETGFPVAFTMDSRLNGTVLRCAAVQNQEEKSASCLHLVLTIPPIPSDPRKGDSVKAR